MSDDAKLTRRPLGKTGLVVSPLALAPVLMGGGSPRDGKLTPGDVEAAYYEHGINTFLFGRQMKPFCEGLRRLIRAGHRDDLVLIAEPSLPFGGSIRRAFEKNARAIGTDSIDVWLLGWVRWRWYVREATWSVMQAQKREGKVKAIGFSCHDRPLAATLARELGVDALMIRYNAAHRGAEREVFDVLGDERPGIIAYTATRWGKLLVPLPKQGSPKALSAPECYRFALTHPAVDTVLCAAQNQTEIGEDARGAALGAFPAERLAEVKRFGDAVHAAARGGARYMFRS